ncbi:hypothetical protein F1643_04600 [Azospirillum sp. INR13]|uniref:hypothetical protein n=1 Tax=Azospirillum sp. INR13 TaxID=2596919 RepID=UPI00189230A6|nr:hypothetical protein [Azospirillum sp. INR13]MBF5093873.1 hypothetical protein [Azospirillum sp. INR13]
MKSQASRTYAAPRLVNEFSVWTSGNLVQNTFLQRTEAILRMQSNLFGGFENLSRNWFEHRQDDIRSALSTVERMGTIEDAAERSSLWNDWMADRMKRWSDQASATVERSFQVNERRAGDAGARRDRKGEETHS